MRKIMGVLLSILLLTACGGNQAVVIDEEEIARIQEIDRMRGKALTEKVLAEREEEKKLAQLEKEKKELEKKEKEVKEQTEKEQLVNDDPKPTTVIGGAKEQSHEVPIQQQSPKPTPPPKEEKPIRLGELGNSGMEFTDFDEADSWAHNLMMDFDEVLKWEKKLGFVPYGYTVVSVGWSDHTFTYSIHFR